MASWGSLTLAYSLPSTQLLGPEPHTLQIHPGHVERDDGIRLQLIGTRAAGRVRGTGGVGPVRPAGVLGALDVRPSLVVVVAGG